MRAHRVVAAAVTVALLAAAPGRAVAAAPGTVTRTFAASTAYFANPGRGFFTYTEARFGAGFVPLDADALAAARRGGRSLVFRVYYLEDYRARDTIGATDLGLVRADLAAVRAAGVKLVVRFAYSADSDADAPVDRVVRHIGQLGPILTANTDVITAVQAGFVGRWGEWYYTRHFAGDRDFSARGRVVAALLAATGPGTFVQVRTPQIKRRTAPGSVRVGVHNDCFLAGADDYGTYLAADDRAWLAAQSRTVPVGGETCAVSARSGWANASAEMAAYHWTYLNPSFHPDVLGSWGAGGLAEASRRLGYRLRLTSVTTPRRVEAGRSATVTITLINEGYAAPLQKRPVQLVLTAGGTERRSTIAADPRTWQPGRTITLTARVTVPTTTTSGVRLHLALPDPAARLAAHPAYAIRLATDGVWDPATGRNTLGALTVSGRGANSAG